MTKPPQRPATSPEEWNMLRQVSLSPLDALLISGLICDPFRADASPPQGSFPLTLGCAARRDGSAFIFPSHPDETFLSARILHLLELDCVTGGQLKLTYPFRDRSAGLHHCLSLAAFEQEVSNRNDLPVLGLHHTLAQKTPYREMYEMLALSRSHWRLPYSPGNVTLDNETVTAHSTMQGVSESDRQQLRTLHGLRAGERYLLKIRWNPAVAAPEQHVVYDRDFRVVPLRFQAVLGTSRAHVPVPQMNPLMKKARLWQTVEHDTWLTPYHQQCLSLEALIRGRLLGGKADQIRNTLSARSRWPQFVSLHEFTP